MRAPPERLALLRLLVGAYALVHLSTQIAHLLRFAAIDPLYFRPVGPIKLLAAPHAQPTVVALLGLLYLSGAGFIVGWRYRLSGPLFAGIALWLSAYRSSWGMIFHTENLLVLHLLVLGVCPQAADVLSFDGRRHPRTAGGDGSPSWLYGWPLALMSALTVSTYFISGVAKLRHGGSAWLSGATLRHTIAANALRKHQLGVWYSPLSAFLIRYDWPFRLFAWLTLLFELGAPLALAQRQLAYGWIAVAWSFHVGVLGLMAIVFGYPLSGIAYGSFLPLEKVLTFCRRAGRRRVSKPQT